MVNIIRKSKGVSMSHVKQYLTEVLAAMERRYLRNKRDLTRMPKGTLSVKRSKSGNRAYLYLSNGAKGKSSHPLKEKDRPLVEKIRLRRIMEQENALLEVDIPAVQRLLNVYQPCDRHTCRAMLSPGYQDDYSYRGFDPPPEKTDFRPQGLVHRNSIGELYRSRIEAAISDLLLNRNLKYDYEPELMIGSRKYRPDFCICHPTKGYPIYFEYFGMMSDEDYALATVDKICAYLNHGLVFGENLMFYFENSKGIDIAAISRVIDMLIQ